MEKMFARKIYLEQLSRHLAIGHPPIQVILGPRQVGKTTAVKTFAKQWPGLFFYHTADLVTPPNAAWIETLWQDARKLTKGRHPTLLIFDEIQKVPRWSEVVKKCYDQEREFEQPLKVILLGSSSLLVQRGLAESLAGRFEIIPFPHWSYEECRQCFDISFEDFLYFGGYPGALQLLKSTQKKDETRWKTYVKESLIETVLNKDILLLNPVSKPALFRQLFTLACLHPAQILSLQKMLGQLTDAGNAATLAAYLKLLDAAMLLKPLEKFSGSRIRQKVSSPKLVILNNALINALREDTFKDARRDSVFWGHLIENMVGAALIQNHYGKNVEVLYWRERDWEVDYILKTSEHLIAIEVKTKAKKEHVGLSIFLKRYPEAKCITTAPGGGNIPTEQLIRMSLQDILQFTC